MKQLRTMQEQFGRQERSPVDQTRLITGNIERENSHEYVGIHFRKKQFRLEGINVHEIGSQTA